MSTCLLHTERQREREKEAEMHIHSIVKRTGAYYTAISKTENEIHLTSIYITNKPHKKCFATFEQKHDNPIGGNFMIKSLWCKKAEKR